MMLGGRKVACPNEVFIEKNPQTGVDDIHGVFHNKKEGGYDQNLFWVEATEENIQALINAEVIRSKDDLAKK